MLGSEPMGPAKPEDHFPVGQVPDVRLNGKSNFSVWTYLGLTLEVLSVELEGMRCVPSHSL